MAITITPYFDEKESTALLVALNVQLKALQDGIADSVVKHGKNEDLYQRQKLYEQYATLKAVLDKIVEERDTEIRRQNEQDRAKSGVVQCR